MAEQRLPIDEQYPNNSHTAKAKLVENEEKASLPQKKVKKVTKGKVTQKKKSVTKRLAEIFGAREGQGVLEYVLHDIVIPATQNMIVDSIIDGAEMAILGEVRGRRRGSGSRSRVRYDLYDDRPSYRRDDRRRDRDYDRRDDRRRGSIVSDIEDVEFSSEDDAMEVLTGLLDIIDTYEQATVQHFYNLAGVTSPDYTVGNYGWTNLSGARTKRVRNGWILLLPTPGLLR